MRVRETTAQCNWVANKKVQQALLSCVVWRASVPAFRSRCLSHCHPPARAATAQTRGLTGGAGRPRFLSFLLGAGLSLLLPWKGWQGGATTLGGGAGGLAGSPTSAVAAALIAAAIAATLVSLLRSLSPSRLAASVAAGVGGGDKWDAGSPAAAAA